MNCKKYLFCVVDDWELRGNGEGNVADLQYAPLRFYLNLAERYGFKITFMAEILQQLRFLQYNQNRDIGLQAHIWEECIALMVEHGHDVQAHMHPQWRNATFKEGWFRVEGSWNISKYGDAEIQALVVEALAYLSQQLRAIDPARRIVAFKAGTWALQPSEKTLPILDKAGIKLVMGPSLGVWYKNNDFLADYSQMQEPLRPYYPDYDHVEMLASGPRNIVILPLPYYRRGFAGVYRRGLEYVWSELSSKLPAIPPFRPVVPPGMEVKSPLAPLIGRSKLTGAKKSFHEWRVFDVGDGSIGEMKFGFDQIMKRFDRSDNEGYVPVIIQSHTKAFFGNWVEIEKFFAYVQVRYGMNAEWATLTQLVERMDQLNPRFATDIV